ncbi:SDR family oxidoreductase [Streptomyces sp. NPDC050560]|uniref:SDR family oxidoreductase n=1 Tax=Streptomyces sp. NPDC050560 TaxID=3365630 RepID=UPI0037A44442
MQIAGSTALVTGANRGLGRSLVAALLDGGAARVYATARDTSALPEHPALTALGLDITDPGSVAAAAAAATDVDLLVNNAGISTGGGILDAESLVRREMETNFFGTLAVSRAFAPVLAANGGGALLNCLSVLSWLSLPNQGGYGAAKAAAWSATNALRIELHGQKTQVTGLLMAYIDTDMTAGLPAGTPKSSPEEIAALALRGVEEGAAEVYADEVTRQVHARLSGPVEEIYPQLAGA